MQTKRTNESKEKASSRNTSENKKEAVKESNLKNKELIGHKSKTDFINEKKNSEKEEQPRSKTTQKKAKEPEINFGLFQADLTVTKKTTKNEKSITDKEFVPNSESKERR